MNPLIGQRRVLKKPLNLAVAFASQLQHVVEIQENGAVQLGATPLSNLIEHLFGAQ